MINGFDIVQWYVLTYNENIVKMERLYDMDKDRKLCFLNFKRALYLTLYLILILLIYIKLFL